MVQFVEYISGGRNTSPMYTGRNMYVVVEGGEYERRKARVGGYRKEAMRGGRYRTDTTSANGLGACCFGTRADRPKRCDGVARWRFLRRMIDGNFCSRRVARSLCFELSTLRWCIERRLVWVHEGEA